MYNKTSCRTSIMTHIVQEPNHRILWSYRRFADQIIMCPTFFFPVTFIHSHTLSRTHRNILCMVVDITSNYTSSPAVSQHNLWFELNLNKSQAATRPALSIFATPTRHIRDDDRYAQWPCRHHPAGRPYGYSDSETDQPSAASVRRYDTVQHSL